MIGAIATNAIWHINFEIHFYTRIFCSAENITLVGLLYFHQNIGIFNSYSTKILLYYVCIKGFLNPILIVKMIQKIPETPLFGLNNSRILNSRVTILKEPCRKLIIDESLSLWPGSGISLYLNFRKDEIMENYNSRLSNQHNRCSFNQPYKL